MTLTAERAANVVRPNCPTSCTTGARRELVKCHWTGAAWICPKCRNARTAP